MSCCNQCHCNLCQCKKPKSYKPVESVSQKGKNCVQLIRDWYIDGTKVFGDPISPTKIHVDDKTYSDIKSAGAGVDCVDGNPCPQGPPGPAGKNGCPGPSGATGLPGRDFDYATFCSYLEQALEEIVCCVNKEE